MTACADCGEPCERVTSVRCFGCTGSFNSRSARDRRVAEYLKLRSLGVPDVQARRRVGVTGRTVYRWRKRGLIP